MPETIYMLSADYGGLENWYEAAFMNESDRNEIALAIAEEVEHANFNQHVAAFMNSDVEEYQAIQFALTISRNQSGWSYANELVLTWEVPLYE